ncbi:hypothetical protein [Actimicrobium antarcticum]
MPAPCHFLLAMCVVLPCAASAQSQQSSDPASADAAVPAVTYTSAFSNYRAVSAEQVSPAKVWRQANDELANTGGHMGGGSSQPESAKPMTPMKPMKPMKPMTPMKPMPQSHAGHGAHSMGEK